MTARIGQAANVLFVLTAICTGTAAAQSVFGPKEIPEEIPAEIRARFDDLQRHLEQFPQSGARADVLAEQTFHRQALFFETDRDPVDVVLRRTATLVEHLENVPGAPNFDGEQARLDALRRQAARVDVEDRSTRYGLFEQIVTLRRKIAWANPLLDFDRILFIKRHFQPGGERTGNHMCDQYFGFHARPGGGLFILENAFSGEPVVRGVLENSVCETGRFQGRKLTSAGAYLSPDLSFDGKQILFAYTDAAEPRHTYTWNENNTWHIFKVDADGSHLRQLTDGPWNDFDPCWLPNGRIVFISERRGGYGRCHARPVPSYTLHSMNADGSDIVCLSPHETNEWHPSVDNNGLVVYTRWDYVDRGFNQAHHPWITTPDGRDARSIHGNFARSQGDRPLMEMDFRAIPDSQRYVTTAAAHHGQAYGSLLVVDPVVEDDNAMAPCKRLTPEIPFPEAEGAGRQVYATAWPLGEQFYLCVYDAEGSAGRGTSNNFGIYLLDAFGNKDLIYRDRAISCLSPIPLRRRRRPPIVPQKTLVGLPDGKKAAGGELPKTAPVRLINVYDSQARWPQGTRITALRIIQVLPKTTWHHHQPRIGYGLEKSARKVLGTVPVEADGSAHFGLPVGKPVFFQALDERGMAVQSMRSVTYAHPGAELVCQGCHEPRHHAPVSPQQTPLAMRREPSKIRPDVDGSNPFSFPRLVQPVLDRHCADCHAKQPEAMDLRAGDTTKGEWYTSYKNLVDYAFFYGSKGGGYDRWTPASTIPGRFGARASKLFAILEKGHYEVKLPKEDLYRITLWLDCNSDFFGSYENTQAQTRGEIVHPTLE